MVSIRWKSIVFSLLSIFIMVVLIPHTPQASNDQVYVVPLHNEVEKGLYAFLKRALEEAKENKAKLVVLDVHTPGGLVDAATEIGKLLDNSGIRTVAFVNDRALSAGAFISLHTDAIYMVPNGQIGAAAIIDQEGNMADKKAQSYWKAAMKSAAETNGLDPIYAMAMADPDINLPKYDAGKGKLLTLTSKQAEEVEYSKGTTSNLQEVLTAEGLANSEIIKVEESFAEKIARFITNPVVVPILLSIASLGLIVELYSPGFGIAGSMGLLSLVLFFYGHLVAGLAGYESILLFILGIILIVVEFFVPGGIVGILGAVSIISSIVIAGESVKWMGISLLIAFGIASLAMIIMVKVLGKRMKFFKKIILTDSTTTEKGYVSNINRGDLLGKIAVTITPLRPSGTVLANDERIDAVSEGGYIEKDRQVKIIKVVGSRIVVREIDQ
ncbi:membrane-bound serine protease (ClpP class) [Oikeobacillus pervagus]|uniref:Membrane-bound serine protease (ClpP class) n=1 Tax=Oikeobacillus pervagus TaxID=1325931 RepID=A0AAJ1T0W5_9BACI|nr:membrane-bound serine protease (ClpP class) [Oikeobacillus pervagus]